MEDSGLTSYIHMSHAEKDDPGRFGMFGNAAGRPFKYNTFIISKPEVNFWSLQAYND